MINYLIMVCLRQPPRSRASHTNRRRADTACHAAGRTPTQNQSQQRWQTTLHTMLLRTAGWRTPRFAWVPLKITASHAACAMFLADLTAPLGQLSDHATLAGRRKLCAVARQPGRA
jgi:hypothetical protein